MSHLQTSDTYARSEGDLGLAENNPLNLEKLYKFRLPIH